MPNDIPGHFTQRRPLKVLRIDSSARVRNSVTRELTDLMIDRLRSQVCEVQVATRDVAQGIPFVSEEWINANFTEAAQRSDMQREALACSDTLVAELMDAEVLVMGVPIYNFGVPAALKAWIDMIARAGRTFRYGENGPVGLLTGKRAYLIMASGGTSIDSNIDFATAYLRHALAFVGITDVEIIAAERLVMKGDEAREIAVSQIMRLAHIPEELAA